MKKYKKTYAILNLAEKHTTFHLGKTKVHVSFTGGQVTKKGVTPATFTTDNPIVQLAIEKSNDFAVGAVTLLAQYPMQGEVKIGMNPPSSPGLEAILKKAGSPAGNCSSGMEAPAFPQAAPVDSGAIEMSADQVAASAGLSAGEAVVEAVDEAAPEPAPAAVAASAGLSAGEEAGEAEGQAAPAAVAASAGLSAGEEVGEAEGQAAPAGALQVVEATCKDVAKQYLQEHYGENPSRLRTRDDVQACAAKYGITFSFV